MTHINNNVNMGPTGLRYTINQFALANFSSFVVD